MPADQRGQVYATTKGYGIRWYDATRARRRQAGFSSPSKARAWFRDVELLRMRGGLVNEPLTLREFSDRYLGLLKETREVATHVQALLRELPTPLEPVVAWELANYRRWYLEALAYLDPEGSRGKFPSGLAKTVEAEVSPDGTPLAICIGSGKEESVPTIIGPVWMQGYEGCLNAFPDPPYGRGSRWPRLCPRCQTRRTNARKKAERRLQSRVARAYQRP